MTPLSNSIFVVQGGFHVFSTNSVFCVFFGIKRGELCWINLVSRLVFLSLSLSNLAKDANSILWKRASALSPDIQVCLHSIPEAAPGCMVAAAHLRLLEDLSFASCLCSSFRLHQASWQSFLPSSSLSFFSFILPRTHRRNIFLRIILC